jgi:ATP-dependent DNA helicase DinG
VDVHGDALSQVIIDKLPFAPPTDPLTAARMRRLEAQHRDPFVEFQLPRAALALKQGFGRLIRRRDDRGIVALLDGRILSKSYGSVFLDTLPAAVARTASIEQARRWWQRT